MSDEPPQYITSSSAQWQKLKPLARDKRHAPTPAEDHLWQRLRNRQVGGAKFRRQHAIEGFIVDFVCIESRLIIEVDGEIHLQADQRDYDVQRQQFLEAKGFRMLRFPNEQVLGNMPLVLQVILAAL